MRLFGRKTPEVTQSVDFTDDTVFAQSFLGSVEEEVPSRMREFLSSGKRGHRPFDEVVQTRVCVLHFASEMLEGSLGMTLPIPQSQLNELTLVQGAMMEVADECATQSKLGNCDHLSEHQWAEWELEILDALIMVHGKAARAVPHNVWKRAHVIGASFVARKESKASAHKVLFNRKREHDLSLHDRYKVMVMIGLANPQQLGEGDLMRTRRIAHKLCTEANLMPGNKKDRSRGPSARFLLSPTQDLAGEPVQDETGTKEELQIDTTRVAITVGSTLKKMIDGEKESADWLPNDDQQTVTVLLRHLMFSWGKPPVRKNERVETSLEARVTIGLNNAFDLMHKIQGPLHSSLKDKEALNDVRGHLSSCNPAQVLDESSGGMRMRIRGFGVAARKGDLVCVANDYSSHIRFTPATIRWVEAISSEEFDIGIQKLGTSMAVVHLTPESEGDELLDTVPVLMVRAGNSESKEWRIVGRTGNIRATRDYSVDVNGKGYSVTELRPVLDEKQIQVFKCELSPADAMARAAAERAKSETEDKALPAEA